LVLNDDLEIVFEYPFVFKRNNQLITRNPMFSIFSKFNRQLDFYFSPNDFKEGVILNYTIEKEK